jgi:hypothetical protein
MAAQPTAQTVQTLTADQAATLLDKSRVWVFNLVKAGFIAKTGRGQYTAVAVIRGVVSYYEDLLKRQTKTASATRVTDARAAEIELRTRERLRQVIPIDDATLALDMVVAKVNEELSGIAPRVTRDMALRRQIEAEVNGAKTRIAEALVASSEFARKGGALPFADAADNA